MLTNFRHLISRVNQNKDIKFMSGIVRDEVGRGQAPWIGLASPQSQTMAMSNMIFVVYI